MKKLLISLLLIACNFAVSPVKAHLKKGHPRDMPIYIEMIDTGRDIGWIESACATAYIGKVSPSHAELVIREILKKATENFSNIYAISIVDETLKGYPQCAKYIPREYLTK